MRALIDLANSLKAFFARTDNPHEVTAAQVDAYDKAYYDNLAIESVIPMDRIPLTRFGNLLWLPINISGSFEGATRTEASWFNAINVEDDGTPVILVNSTNGVRESVYFSYLGLSESKQIISHTPVATEYRPAFLQANETIRNVNGCSAKTAVWGVLAGNDEFDSWICLTGGTLNPAVHVGARFKRPDELIGQWGVSFASGQYAYIMMPRGDHCSIAVWRCPIIDIQTKASVVFEKVRGIKTYGARSEYTDDNIRVGGVAYSKNEADKPVFLITGDGFNPPGDQRQLWGDVSVEDGSIWMRSLHVGQIRYGNTNMGVGLGYTVRYDPIENVARLVPNQYGGFNIDPKNEAPGWTISRRGVNISQYDLNFAATGQPHDSAAIGTNGQIIKVNYANENAGNVQSFTIEKFSSHWEAWDFMQTKVKGINTKSLIRQYPGSFGDSARCTHVLSENKLGVYSVANHPTDPFSRQTTFSMTEYTEPTFDYQTARLGDLKGYQPKARDNRHDKIRIGHCEYVDFPANSVKVGGGRLWESQRSNYRFTDVNFIYFGEVSVGDALWDSVKQRLVAMAPEASQNPNYVKYLELQIFHDAALPCIGFLHILHNDGSRQCHRMMFSFFPNVRTGEITDIQLGNVWYNSLAGDTASVTVRGKDNFVPTTVFHNTDEGFSVVSINSIYALQQSGSQPTLMGTLMHLDGAGEYRTDWTKLDNSNPWYFGFRHYGTIPRLGFGQYDMTANRGLSGTGIVFRVIGTSKADIERYTGDRQVMIMSQQAPVGWFAFISEPVPCLMGGKYAEVPAATLALESYEPNPANKRFNIYVVLKNGKFSYELDQGERPETLTSCWVGFIETGAINVTRLWIEKVNRIDIYRLSEGQIGSAIPIVPGSPLGAGTLDWVKNA